MHSHEGADDPSITKYVYALLRMLGARSVLDVSTATGRGLCDFKRALPELFVCGVWFHPLLTSGGVLLCAIKEESLSLDA